MDIFLGETPFIGDGGYIPGYKFHLFSDNYFNCEVPTYGGCLPITDYTPNVRKSPVTMTCADFVDDDPIGYENCGPAQTIKKTVESVESTEENISVSSTTTTTLEI